MLKTPGWLTGIACGEVWPILSITPNGQADMMSYAIESPGKIGKGKVFCTLQQPLGKKGGGGDGLTIDAKGNLYITSGLGLQVFDPAGKFVRSFGKEYHGGGHGMNPVAAIILAVPLYLWNFAPHPFKPGLSRPPGFLESPRDAGPTPRGGH